MADLVAAICTRMDDTAQFNAFTYVDADDIERQVRGLASTDPGLPLYGMPVAVKDLIDQVGYATTSGVRRDHLPKATQDAPVVAALRSAGAILIGRTNLHQLAAGVTSENPHFGGVGNPHDISRIAGGSSGGSAACVVLGSAAGAVGTDTGGSIRIPAALCGAVGLKPTFGAVSTVGVRPLAWTFDHVGPIARSVRDAMLLFRVMSGRAAQPDPMPRIDDLRFAVVDGYFSADIAPEILGAVDRAGKLLGEAGARQVRLAPPDLEAVWTTQYTIYPFEAATALRDREASGAALASQELNETLGKGERITVDDYLRAQRARAVVRARIDALFDGADVLLVPTTAALAARRHDVVREPTEGRQRRKDYVRLCCPFNQSRHPAMSVPCGERDGLPIGVQLVARYGAEATLAVAASVIEAGVGGTSQRPPPP